MANDVLWVLKGFDILNLCKRFGFDNILTKGPKKLSNAWSEKVLWCQRYLGNEADIHITSDKGLVYGKLLYDDYPEYMLRWLKHRPRGLGIMPLTESNKDFKHPNVVMYDGTNLEQIAKIISGVKSRKSGEDLCLAG